jgi:thymidylate synthase (FAD)
VVDGVRVEAVGWTQFAAPPDIEWTTDADGGDALVEFAGRACYESWDKPNPATATNASYLRHVLQVGHLAALEHGTATLFVRGVSRALTHELVRHRHLSFSELSPRQALGVAPAIEPPSVAADPELHARFTAATESAVAAYQDLLAGLEARAAGETDAPLRRKQARQEARAVLPNAMPTQVVITANYRAWRHFVAMRASAHADLELRMLALACLAELRRIAPNAFADFVVTRLPDGTSVASTPFVGEN